MNRYSTNKFKPSRLSLTILLCLLLSVFFVQAQEQGFSASGPEVTCPESSIVNICAPVASPAPMLFEDFNPSDDNTATEEIDFVVEETVATLTDVTVVTQLYTFTDKDGNSNRCELVYNIANSFIQAPEIPAQKPICQDDLFSGIKLGGANYIIYYDDNGKPGNMASKCDQPGLLCATEKLGIDPSVAGVSKIWITEFISFPDASVCESEATALSLEVLEKPTAKLTSPSHIAEIGVVLSLTDFVEENKSGYWTGDGILSVATASGSPLWVFTPSSEGVTKLYYTVTNGICNQTYLFLVEVEPEIMVDPYFYEEDIFFGDYDFIGVPGPGGAPGPLGPGGFPGSTSLPGSSTGGDPLPFPEPYPDYPYEPGPQPNQGLVTAGEWNDLENWEFLDTLLNENEYYEMPDYWSFYPSNRIAVDVTDTDGNYVIDATVNLIKDDEVVWAAKTSNTGRAELWPTLCENDSIDRINIEDYSLVVNEEAIRGSLKFYEDGINEVTLIGDASASRAVEISFIVDATGSMADELEFLKLDLTDVIDTVEANNPNLEISTSSVFYRDEGDEYVVRHSNFTTDLSNTIGFIRDQRAQGGGDFPEAVHTALSTAVNELQWSENIRARIAFLLLDAPPHYNEEVIRDIKTSIKKAAELGIRIIPITASGIDKETEFLMRFFAMATNGTYTFITNDSGIGGDHIDPSIGDFDVEFLNALMVRLINEYTE